jgi:magnesium transporter
LAILTIFFTLSIPATLFSTYYGMNVYLPGGIESGAATFLGEYTTFIVTILLSIVPAVIMLYWFKKGLARVLIYF